MLCGVLPWLCSRGRPSPRPAFRALRALRLAAALLIALAALAAPASAQDVVLVTNEGETVSSLNLPVGGATGTEITQRFRTGGDRAGYALSSVGIKLNRNEFDAMETLNLLIYSSNAAGKADSQLYALTNPYSDGPDLPTTDFVEFTAPAGANLKRNTDYHVVFRGTGNQQDANIETTTSDGQTGEPGWSIEDALRVDGSHDSEGRTARIRIKGISRSGIDDIAITSTPALAWNTYGAGEAIKITTTFDTAVDVTGSPKLTIVVGNQIKRATYESGSGSATLVFSYTVQAADRDHGYRHGIKIHAGPSGGTIRNKGTTIDANPAVKHLDRSDLHFPNHRVSGGDPGTGSSLVSNLDNARGRTGASGISSAQSFRTGPSAATLRAVRVHATLSAANTVSIHADSSGPGSMLETLQPPSSFSTAGYATYEYRAAGQGRRLEPNTTYWVVFGSTSGDPGTVGFTSDTDEESPRQWSIADRYWSNSSGSWQQLSFAGSLMIAVDGFAHAAPPVPPKVTGAPVISRAGPDCNWSPGEEVDVTLTFDEAMTVVTTKGTPSIELRLGSKAPRKAEYHAGTGTTTLTFRYTIATEDGNNVTMVVPRGSIALNGGTIRNADGVNAALAHPTGAVGLSTPASKRCAPPLVSNRSEGGSALFTPSTHKAQSFTTSGAATLTDVLVFGASFDSGTRISIHNDNSGEPGTLLAAAESTTEPAMGAFVLGKFDNQALAASTTYWVVMEGAGVVKKAGSGQNGLSGWSLGDKMRIRAGGATWSELDHAMTVELAGSGSAPATNNPAPPTVDGTPSIADPGDGAWAPGDAVEVTLTFSEAVTVDTADGAPTLRIGLGGPSPARDVTYTSGSGTTELVFAYTLADGDGTHTSMFVIADSLALNGGTIRSTGTGADADLTHVGAAVPARSTKGPREPRDEGNTGLTASFESLPDDHDGASAFTFELAFSEEAVTSWRTVRDGLLDVSGGSITHVKRTDPGSADPNLRWTVTVEPAGSDDVSITLPVRACTEANAACADGKALSREVSATVPLRSFAGRFASVPGEHDGSRTFTLEFHLNTEPGETSWRTIRDSLFEVGGGGIVNASRLNAPSNKGWRLVVQPDGNDDVTLTVKPTTSCGALPGICTPDGRMLEGGPQATIAGPLAFSVSDAEVDEAAGATLDFTVTLSRASSSETTVDYATSDGTAVAGSDYTAASGTLTFPAGTTSKTVKVKVLDDAHDEGSETMTFTLSNASGAALGDAEATGTIRNTDAMPQAWIARFGRTVAEQVLDAVESRLEAPRSAGAEASLAGQLLGGERSADEAAAARERREAESAMTAVAEWLGGEAAKDREASQGFETRTMSGREALPGSSFALTGGNADRGFGAVWGRASVSGFDGREGDLTVDGQVTSGILGADWSRGRATAGLAIAHSRGEGSYRGAGGNGDAESTLTGVYPYGRYALNRNLSLWGVAGLGRGKLTLEPRTGARIETDLELAMGAVGLRGVLVEAPADGGMELAAKTDGMAMRTSTDAARGADGGNLAASEADVTRFRVGLQATWRGMDAGGGELTPTMEVGARHDGGDAETGYGADFGAGLVWSDPERGISADVRARALLAHEADGFRQRGFSGTLSWDPEPATALGPSLTLSQSVGAASSGGAEALLGRRHLDGLAPADGGDDLERRSLDARLGYGFPLFGGGYTGTPELGLGLTERHRETSLGWHLAEVRSDGLAFGLDVEGARRESTAGEAPPERRLGLGLGWRLEGARLGAFELRLEGMRLDAANDDREHRVRARMSARW